MTLIKGPLCCRSGTLQLLAWTMESPCEIAPYHTSLGLYERRNVFFMVPQELWAWVHVDPQQL